MKHSKLLSYSAIFCLALLAPSCSLFDKAGDVTFDANFETTFITDENATGTNVTYEDSRIVDATVNPEILKYKDKIKSITIKRITYKITNYSAIDPCNASPVIFSDGLASFGDISTTTKDVSVPFASASGVNLQTTTSETDLTINADQFSIIANLILKDKKVKMYSGGTLSCTPVSFNVVAKFYVSITANALK